MIILTDIKIEEKWQRRWQEIRIFQSDPNNKKKIFVTVAYPYPSGAMHIGHGRTYTVPDVYARFKRMQGYNVLFPMAWHVTGAPVVGIANVSKGMIHGQWIFTKIFTKYPKKKLKNLLFKLYCRIFQYGISRCNDTHGLYNRLEERI